jgi:transcriptional regulator with XRE-family HTH domain
MWFSRSEPWALVYRTAVHCPSASAHDADMTMGEDEALRAAIRRRLAEKGWTAGDVARTLGAPENRFYKALSGERGMTAGTLALFAEALGTTVTNLRRSAGVLSNEERRQIRDRVRFEDFVSDDPLLTKEDQETLIGLYRRLTGGPLQPGPRRPHG